MQNSGNLLTTERWVLPILLFFIGIHLFWMGSLKVYPFVDIPYHLAESTIYRYYAEPGNEFAHYYSKKFDVLPNTLYLLFCASSVFPGVEFANHVYFALYVLLFPISIFLVIRQLNGNPWFVFLSFLLIYNYNVHYGFGGFMLSIPAFFIFFYLLLRSVSRDSLSWAIFRSFWLLLLFFIHGLTGLFSLMFFFLHSLYQHKGDFRTLIRRSLVAIPALLAAVQWWFFKQNSPGEQWNVGSIKEYFTGAYLENLNLRASLLINDNKWLYADPLGSALALLLSLFILIPLIPWVRHRFRHRHQDNGRKALGSIYLLIFASLACWFLMPGRIQGQSYIFDRFSVFFLLSIIILLSADSWRLKGRWKAWALTGCVLHALLWSHYFYDFRKESASFTPEIFPGGKDETLCALIYDKRFRGRNVYQHFPLYYIVWKQGIACARFIDMRYVTLIRRKASEEELPRYLEDVGRRLNITPDYGNMDYLLVRRHEDTRVRKVISRFRLLRSSGRWFLYQHIDRKRK